MESLKPILLLIVLGGVGYGVYVALNHAPPSEPLPSSASPWNKPAGGAPASANSAGGGTEHDASSAFPNSSQRDGNLDAGSHGLEKLHNPTESALAPASSAGASPINSSGISLPFGIGSSAMQQAGSNVTSGHSEIASPTTLRSSGDRGMVSGVPSQSASQNTADAVARHEFAASIRTAESLAKEGKLVEALRELSRWYDHPAVPTEEQSKLVGFLSQLSGTVIYSKQHWLAAPHVVSFGESLESIAQQYQVPWQLLAKINGISSPNSLTPGEELKVVRGPFTAQLNCQQDCLTLFVDGLYAGRFQVQGGRNLVKPEGKYAVAKVAADDPSNGTRRPYISLGGDLQLRVPDDAGVQPAGSVSISPSDMNDVFDMLSSRSEVTIRR